MDILEQYKKQFEIDKQNENYDPPKIDDPNVHTLEGKVQFNEKQMEAYKKELDKLRSSDEELIKKFNNTFIPLKEQDLFDKGKLSNENIQIKLIRAYCPECGEEIICKMPSMFNAFTLEKFAKYECPKCGAKYNLENSYPRLAVFDYSGNEIKCFLE